MPRKSNSNTKGKDSKTKVSKTKVSKTKVPKTKVSKTGVSKITENLIKNHWNNNAMYYVYVYPAIYNQKRICYCGGDVVVQYQNIERYHNGEYYTTKKCYFICQNTGKSVKKCL